MDHQAGWQTVRLLPITQAITAAQIAVMMAVILILEQKTALLLVTLVTTGMQQLVAVFLCVPLRKHGTDHTALTLHLSQCGPVTAPEQTT